MQVELWFNGDTPGVDEGLVVEGSAVSIVGEIGAEDWATLKGIDGREYKIRTSDIIACADMEV